MLAAALSAPLHEPPTSLGSFSLGALGLVWSFPDQFWLTAWAISQAEVIILRTRLAQT
jgi:hypothetical protein